ncbi:diguanylate cyclase domain-containing protein [Pseudoalteromonas phenolica]
MTVSIGIASSEDEEISSNKLISYADVAMYESKHIGKHAITIYKPNMHF